MNDPLALELAEYFTERLERPAGASREKQIEMAFRNALSRQPDASETEWSMKLLNQQMKRYQSTGVPPHKAERKAMMHLCRVLFNSSEFLYLE